MNEYKPYMYN